ncbi:TolC family protein [Variovorax guangxiensis]|uniref:TolC family protein n=1 Tax=Variovorax guangxiensis TaxID=1775474 RepID=UPI002858C0CA|nr:TolC family protein [Variovorax guangxiensis]MDR6855248.1 outer membrane protein TolC [Variovorax guangxiensis]
MKNQDIRIAEVQVREARALVQNARAAWYPSLGVDASVSRARSQTSTGSTTLGNAHARSLQASWEPDLWGRCAARSKARASACRRGELLEG